MLSLVPVVEFAPIDYAKKCRKLSCRSSAEDVNKYWRDSLLDSGIDELEPFWPGSWFVAVSKLTRTSTLRLIVRNALSDRGESWDLDEIGPIIGGYMLVQDDFLIEPGCCGDLGDLGEWRDACKSRSTDWQDVWIGHPWTYVRGAGELLTFAAPTEGPATLEGAMIVKRSELEDAINEAAQVVRSFRDRLLPVVAELEPPLPAGRIVDVLTEGHRREEES